MSQTSIQSSHSNMRVLSALNELHLKYKDDEGGKVADYIPELAKASPQLFGICAVDVNGNVYEVGDYAVPFTIQSISKPFIYGLALEDHGRDHVLNRVGVEPTGDAFNSIISLDETSKRPHNPMVNAGAIAMSALIKGDEPTTRLNRVLDMFRCYMGLEPHVDMPVFLSERTTGNRNRAIAYLMKNFEMIDGNIDEHLDLYFQQCSIKITCRDLAVMAATLANKGRNPITHEQAVHPEHIRDILSVMYTCGMYDYSGEWAYRVGLPAKSGVGGGVLAVVPGKMGIGVFSPPLDPRGNSVRGVQVCQELSKHFGLHMFDAWFGEAGKLNMPLRVTGNDTPEELRPEHAGHGNGASS